MGRWLYGVACRVALHARSEAARRRSRERPGDSAGAVSGAAGAEAAASNRELASALDEELARLPAKYREPIVLCLIEGHSHEEAARRLRWPVGSVKGRLARARDLLKGRLARRGLAPAAGAIVSALAADARAAVPPTLMNSTLRAATAAAAGGTTAGAVSAAVLTLVDGVLTTMSLSRLKIGAAALLALGTGAGVLAYQASNGPKGKPAVKVMDAPKRPGPGLTPPADPDAENGKTLSEQQRIERYGKAVDRLDHGPKAESIIAKLNEPIAMSFPNETPLEDVLKYIRSATSGPTDTGVPIYVDPAGLEEAGKTATSPVSVDVKGVPLKDSLHLLLRPQGLDYRVTRGGLLSISSRDMIRDEEIEQLRDDLARVSEQLKAAERRAVRPAAPPPSSAKPGAGQDSGAAAEWRFGKDPKSLAVVQTLEKPIPMSFANETSLEDVLKYIRSETAQDGKEIPIYVDPVGLQEAEKTMTSPITIDLEGVPLRITLDLLLRQLGLKYKVRDGLLTIIFEDAEDNPFHELLGKSESGELTPDEYQKLIVMLKARNEIHKLQSEREIEQAKADVEAAKARKEEVGAGFGGRGGRKGGGLQ